MAQIVEEYKIGVKREIIGALRKVFGNAYPDPQFAGRVSIVEEYPVKEVTYPMLIMHYSPQTLQNIGLGHYELAYDEEGNPMKIIHWDFNGSVTLTAYAQTPLDRDMLVVGLLNILAYEDVNPLFKQFKYELRDYDFAAIQVLTEQLQEGGDSVVQVPWGSDEEPIFTGSISFPIFGEFFSHPDSSDLIEIGKVKLYPYHQGQPIPQGSTATLGTPGTPDYKDDSKVGWVPSDS